MNSHVSVLAKTSEGRESWDWDVARAVVAQTKHPKRVKKPSQLLSLIHISEPTRPY